MLDHATLDAACALANRLADAAAAAVLPHFRVPSLVADDKGQGVRFDPVTAADREAEEAMCAILRRERPGDAVLGEEHGSLPGRSGLTWILDPIDGTRAFITGLPTWGTLIALDDGTSECLGVIDQPYIGERFFGLGYSGDSHAWLDRSGSRRPIRTRAASGLANATLFTTAPEIFAPEEWDLFNAVRNRVRLVRYGIDCYAYALLAMGHIDLVIEAGLARYDIAAPAALVRAAGGVVTDWQGGDYRSGGQAIAAGDGRIHGEALALLADAQTGGRS